MSAPVLTMTPRYLALLRAVATGHAVMVCGCHPDLLVDGRWCCDQAAAHALAAAGLIAPAALGAVGQRVTAELTAAGRAALEVAA